MKMISLQDFRKKEVLLDELRPKVDTWVVSDLQSKWEIQGKLLKSHAVLEEDAVLRASEFWAKLLFRLDSEWTLLSKELFDQWIWNWVHENPLPWIKANESASLIHAHLEFFAPLFLETSHQDLIEEWFEKNPDSVIKWRHIYEICQRLWQDLSRAHLVSSNLVPAVLLYELGEKEWDSKLWERRVVLDLGPQPRKIECDLAEKLSTVLDIQFIQTETSPKNLLFQGELLRLPTQLGEVKQVVASVRNLLDRNESSQKIAILAPDIERFWPSLHYFFKVEGVPVNKAYVQRLIDDPSLQKWMSLLRVKLDHFNRRDLESFFFQKSSELEMSFEEFRHYFETLKTPLDAFRWKSWKGSASPGVELLTLLEFFDWALMHWPKSFSADPLERVWKVLSRDYHPRIKMKVVDWFFYMESKLSKSETVVEEAQSHGVQLLSLSSSEWVDAEHVFFIGLNESELMNHSSLLVSNFEGERLKQDLGFELDVTSHSANELYLSWISSRNFKKKYFFTSGVTFSGEEVSPSKHWLKSVFLQDAKKVKEVVSPSATRFDELARQCENPQNQFDLTPFNDISLSATSIKSYFKCPFIFFAGKGLQLEDQPVLDFDLDPLNKGRILHGVLEQVIKDLYRYESTEALLELIEQQKDLLGISMGEERIWPAMKQELFQLSQNFILMEKELRRENPDLKTLGSEINFEVFFDPHQGKFSKGKDSEASVRLKGRLDRVDGDSSGKMAVVDYKLSSSQLLGWYKWIEEGDLQMPLYALALEEGFTDLTTTGEVTGAYYLVPRTKERNRGYFLKGEEGLFIKPSSRSHSWITGEKKSDLLNQMSVTLKQVVEEVQKGDFSPQPKKYEICETCRWRRLCRAPHLI